ncbi:hypothetical protein FNV43_RR15694 [Rhamnella rubrinervis]|uniref:Glycosyltransferase n=1 Tax=Rhamnella rubrinervis TaxID=2594499 RepID=A0A8K0E9D2_9ROSA|nr:hypothetical protein FNV43_RR15694 [Rhamnella rubrinervis]
MNSRINDGNQVVHFVLIPFMSPGHLIPMIDMGRLLAQHGMVVTIVTTPLNAHRFNSTIQRDQSQCGLKIQLLSLHFPSLEAGLPEGCENTDKLPSRISMKNFFVAVGMLQQPFEQLLATLQPPATCIVSGKNLPWTVDTCRKFRIPRIFFDGMGCFALFCTNILETSKVHEGVLSDSDPFLVPGIPHRIELTKRKLPESLNPVSPDLTEVRDRMRAGEVAADGILVNTFEDLEAEYVEEYKRVKGNNNVWCIGPVSACNKSKLDRMDRGEKMASKDVNQWLKWLDSWEPGSVIYACLGSICGLKPWQLKELGLGLEESKQPFIWVIRGGEKYSQGLEEWLLEEGFEERTSGRGLVIRGWAPQVLILSHPSIGGFLTHCGWNSTLEGVEAGVPLLTCPLFAEQFMNESLVVDVVGIGVRVGVEAAVTWGLEDKAGLVIKRESVRKAVEKVTENGEEADERRKKARELGKMAKMAIGDGGSSYLNIDKFIHFVKQQSEK